LRELVVEAGVAGNVEAMDVEALRDALRTWIVSGDATQRGADGFVEDGVEAKIADLDMKTATIGDLKAWVLVMNGHATHVSADQMRHVVLREAIRSQKELDAMECVACSVHFRSSISMTTVALL
tara:strand:+ start:164 stop:535 length:372 start_codon:yes stop_codon:yes gene_type:complete